MNRITSFVIDNIYVMYQFLFSSDYCKEKMKIHLGEEKLNDISQVESSIMKFIRSTLG